MATVFFHNHLTLDPVNALFEDPAGAWEVLRRIRLELFTHAFATAVPGIVFTYANRLEDGDEFLTELAELANRWGAVCQLVQLVCPVEVLELRVVSPERHVAGRTHDVATLAAALSKADLFATIPGTVLSVDTSLGTPGEIAAQVDDALRSGRLPTQPSPPPLPHADPPGPPR
jgi:hypothetical protein